ncbi:hypothetical protein SOVF_031670 [Spinacia oleracea]|nr:hypothetical protein SOVF_031670 [Spinacia oleracea]
MENTTINNIIIVTNGENPKIIEGANEQETNSEEQGVAQIGDTNGFTVHQIGIGAYKEIDIESDASTFKGPETSVGIQVVMDDTSNVDNAALSEMHNGDNIVIKTLVINVQNIQNQVVVTEQTQEVEPEIVENAIKKLIQNQETHDLFCRNCKSCVTKRVILKRSLKHGDVIVPIPDETHVDTGPDIMKAIVYGGLWECITSLSVISSAAGVDATTLNIVALGLANVFGGLVLLLRNLRLLKHEQATASYEDQLGRPGHFLLHAVVTVISYLIFGLISPIIYGFAFRKSDNKDYKLGIVAAASLVCIIFLSIVKANVQRPKKPYIQTILSYISVGFMISGAGYVAGYLINMLLKKLGIFDPRAPVTMYVPEAVAMEVAWSSY